MSSNPSYYQEEKKSVEKGLFHPEKFDPFDIDDTVNRLLWCEAPALNPIEDALINKKTLVYYIPSKNANSYKLLALQSLGQWLELLKEKMGYYIDPKYEFEIGKESYKYNGDIDEHGRVIINFRGSARLG